MKRIARLLPLLIMFLHVSFTQAQGQGALESLFVDFWPDYDQPSVLVLMTANLPAETQLPATVTLPLPEGARLNAVAYIDAVNGMMNAEYVEENGNLIISTPNPSIRVEYYLPYSVTDGQHSFTFSWQSDMAVNEFQAKVQQPAAASSLIIEPAAANVSEGDDGFTYHILPTQTILAGQSLAINVNYNMTSSQLSAESANNATIDLQPAGPAPAATATPEVNWPLFAGIGGGILVVVALAFLYFGNRPKTRVRKPSPMRQPKTTVASFCHNCGQTIGPSDRFCRHCGTPVKGA